MMISLFFPFSFLKPPRVRVRVRVRVLSGFVSISIHLFVIFFTFLNACISVKTSLINTKLGDFGNLGVLFLPMGINSC